MTTNPFRFPDELHQRSQSPEQLLRYQDFKPVLRVEFSKKCVYCRDPDTVRGSDGYGVDHYLPRKHFPHLVRHYPNLFYACNPCNRRKGIFVSTADLFIPNPCDHRMAEHLRFDDGHVEALTVSGRFACELLLLNEPERKRFRTLVLRSIESNLRVIEELRVGLERIEAEMRSPKVSDSRAAGLGSERAAVIEDLRELDQVVALLSGL